MTTTIVTDIIDLIGFRGDRLAIAWDKAEPYLAVKPICDLLGLAWQPQYRKLTSPDSEAVITMMVTTGADSKRYEMLCIHVRDVPWWVATIQTSRVKPELRESLRAYKDEIKTLVFNHVCTRLLGEREAALEMATKFRTDLICRRPLWVRIRDLHLQGWEFERIWRASKTTRGRVIEALGEMARLGLIDRLPKGTPLAEPLRPDQADMSASQEG